MVRVALKVAHRHDVVAVAVAVLSAGSVHKQVVAAAAAVAVAVHVHIVGDHVEKLNSANAPATDAMAVDIKSTSPTSYLRF